MTINNLSAAKGDSKGEINLHWDSVENSVSYIIEIAHVNHLKDVNWKVLDIISESFYRMRKLKSNKNYYFRVASINRDGQGKWSKEISKITP